jgi:uncharacterized protein
MGRALSLWVSSTNRDIHIFATVRNIAPDGHDELELGQQGQLVPVTNGWLRASTGFAYPEGALPGEAGDTAVPIMSNK